LPVHVHLPEELVTEILVRLPGKSVLRFRAVSRAWRRITTDPAFLAAHARHRPLEILLCTTVRRPRDPPRGYGRQDTVLDTIPVSADHQADRQRLIRYPYYTKFKLPNGLNESCLLLASCEGVLLLRVGRGIYLICNPVTRQWAELPRPPANRLNVLEYGFYYHQQSGEFRLLCRCFLIRMAHVDYILSTGATEPRALSMTVAMDEPTATLIDLPSSCYGLVPVTLHGRLHWLRPVPSCSRDRMVVFDTESETFHHMTPPPTPKALVKIFTMDGLLVAADFADMWIDLWFLADYGTNGRWERRHQVATPPINAQLRAARPASCLYGMNIVMAGTDDGEDIILRGTEGLLVVHNVKTKSSRVIDPGSKAVEASLRRVFRESLVQHEGFNLWSSDGLAPLIDFSWSPA
ncbi:hypothetical protein EJB05_51117, partial [Eragrostis curvula]